MQSRIFPERRRNSKLDFLDCLKACAARAGAGRGDPWAQSVLSTVAYGTAPVTLLHVERCDTYNAVVCRPYGAGSGVHTTAVPACSKPETHNISEEQKAVLPEIAPDPYLPTRERARAQGL